ncbi:MAG: DUF4388 domain-containing protein [Thermodesulfovibrio sp.]|uniref:DUF4388 domain-containing protein n=1 Tax=unclassified Thermodesulfovibrio TaxID=2645936 RepID=UPI00083AAE02|nr:MULTISPECIES: DUF4388 domain-containing protein [unclassified Thermodesulfovibrio]MDI1470965.1 DUF4388 domain-containing protein [Thermodesulfovibrio sp. 1176]MDI6713815.1 DUF4388 domain-containing protein [Thermodesulfovibrio sp.]ODA43644.1 hypothetical protein THER_1644 [Thermodesulfovibrio sp. N1]
MKKDLGDIVDNLSKTKSTGLLTINLSSDKNLLKIYLKDGSIYHISYGFKKGFECLNEIASKEPISYNFIPQIAIDIVSTNLPATEKIITTLKQMNKTVTDSALLQTPDLNKIKENIKMALVKQIGPIGGKITEKYINEKWIPSQPPNKEDFLRLVEMLKEEIEDPKSKKEFIEDVNKFLGGL